MKVWIDKPFGEGVRAGFASDDLSAVAIFDATVMHAGGVVANGVCITPVYYTVESDGHGAVATVAWCPNKPRDLTVGPHADTYGGLTAWRLK